MPCAWIEKAARHLARVHLSLTDQGVLVAFSRAGAELGDMAVRELRVMTVVPIHTRDISWSVRKAVSHCGILVSDGRS